MINSEKDRDTFDGSHAELSEDVSYYNITTLSLHSYVVYNHSFLAAFYRDDLII